MGFRISRTFIIGVFLSEESISLIKIWEKWPLGGQNGDFIYWKLNNRLVHPVSVEIKLSYFISPWNSDSKTVIIWGCWELQQCFVAAWKLQTVFNIKNALIQLAETSLLEVFSFEKSIALTRFCEKCPLDGQNGDILKIASVYPRFTPIDIWFPNYWCICQANYLKLLVYMLESRVMTRYTHVLWCRYVANQRYDLKRLQKL